MAIFYKLRYRKNSKLPNCDGYYAVICNKGVISTDVVAEEIQENCSMKRSDVLAVLAELREVIKNHVQQSHSVKLDGIGVFRPGIRSKMSKSVEEFDPRKKIVGLRLNFLPEQFKQGRKCVKFVFDKVKLTQELKPVKKPDEGGSASPGI